LTVPLATVWHNFERTEISITDNYSIDPLPVDPVFAEFELWPHDRGELLTKSPVTAVYFTAPGR
jgi:hypothetical protein